MAQIGQNPNKDKSAVKLITLDKDWTTYVGPLIKVLHISQGDVVELGVGPVSTPLLHWVCQDMNRKLISYENDPAFYEIVRQYESYFHEIVFVKDWDEIDTMSHRGLVFDDHLPMDRRAIEAIRFKDSADYLVMHDTEKDNYYSEVWQHFKYIYTWKEYPPWTSVVSNFKDLTILNTPANHQ